MLASSITCSQAPPPQLLSHIVVHTCVCNAVRVIQVGGGALLAQGHAQASTCVPAGMLLIQSRQGWFVRTDRTTLNQPLHGTVYLLASQQVSGICTCNTAWTLHHRVGVDGCTATRSQEDAHVTQRGAVPCQACYGPRNRLQGLCVILCVQISRAMLTCKGREFCPM